jgi:hypothetical protein
MTETISIGAPPQDVLQFVANPANLPLWAPAFARRVKAAGRHWIVEGDEAALKIDVRVSRGTGTVDFLAAEVPPGVVVGAFCRVLPNGDGSELMFTRFVAPDELAATRATVVEELQTVRRFCELQP